MKKSLLMLTLIAGLATVLWGPLPASAQSDPLADPALVEPVLVEDAAMGDEVEPKSQGSLGLLLFVFVLAIFLGFELIAKVPSQLHTPLMSGSNAISGITIVGAILASGGGNTAATVVLGTLAVAFAMINVAGGYLVTDRMLGMFTHKKSGGDK